MTSIDKQALSLRRNLRKEEIMRYKVLIQLVCLLSCVYMTACINKNKTRIVGNNIYLYAPGNKVTVHYMKANYHYGEKTTLTPVIEVFSDSSVHYLSGGVEDYYYAEVGGTVLPEGEYYYHITASNTTEYYVYMYIWETVNGNWGRFIDHCEHYSPEKVFKAIKEQAPDKILCISSTEEQIVKGNYFLPPKSNPPTITITNE